jgi:hypothetical protein
VASKGRLARGDASATVALEVAPSTKESAFPDQSYGIVGIPENS